MQYDNVTCPGCGRTLRLPVSVIGSSVACPVCKTTFDTTSKDNRVVTIAEATLVDDPPPAQPLDDIPLASAVEEVPLAPMLEEIPDGDILDAPPSSRPPPPPPPPGKVRRRTVDGKSFSPVRFVAFVQRDPEDKLEGRFEAEVDPDGMTMWRGKGRKLAINRGAKVQHKGGSRLMVEIEGRNVDLTIIAGEGDGSKLAKQLGEFFNGERDTVALPGMSVWPLVPVVLLPLAIPLCTGLFGENISGIVPTMFWGMFALILVGVCCLIVFLLRGTVLVRGFLACVVCAIGFTAMGFGFLVDSMMGVSTNTSTWNNNDDYSLGVRLRLPPVTRSTTRNNTLFRDGFARETSVTVKKAGVSFLFFSGLLADNPNKGFDPLDRIRSELIATPGTRITREFPIAHPSPGTRSFEFQLSGAGNSRGKARLYLSKKRMAVLIAMHENGNSEDRLINAAFGTFSFNPRGLPGEDGGPVVIGPGPIIPIPPPTVNLGPGGKLLTPIGNNFVWAGVAADGRIVGVRQRDQYILWDATGRKLNEHRVLTPQDITWGTLSPNRLHLVMAGHSGPVHVIKNLNDARRLTSFDIQNWALWSVAYSSTGQIATAHGDSKIRLWNADTLRLERTLDAGPNQILSVAYSPDGTFLAAANANRMIRIFNLKDKTERTIKEAHAPPPPGGGLSEWKWNIRSLCFACDNRMLASASNDQKVKIWDVTTGRAMQTLSHPDAVMSVAFYPSGRVLVTGCNDGRIRVWNTADGLVRDTIRNRVAGGGKGEIRSLEFSADGKTLVAATSLGVERWDFGSQVFLFPADRIPLPNALGKIPAAEGAFVKRMAVSRDLATNSKGKFGFFLSATATGYLRRFTMPDFLPAGSFRIDRYAYRLLMSPDKETLYVFRDTLRPDTSFPLVGNDVELMTFAVADLKESKGKSTLAVMPKSRKKLEGVIFSPILSSDGKIIFYLDKRGKRLVGFDTATQEIKHDIKLDLNPIAASLSPDGKKLYVAISDLKVNRVLVYDTTTMNRTFTLNLTDISDLFDIAAGNNDQLLLSARRRVVLLEIGKITKTRHSLDLVPFPYHVKVSPDGKMGYLVPAKGIPSQVLIWPMDDPKKSKEIEVTIGTSTGEFIISDDGKFLLMRGAAMVQLPKP